MNKLSAAIKIFITLAILATVVFCSQMIITAMSHSFSKANQIHVRGVAEQTLISDRVNWTLSSSFSSKKSEWAKASVDKSINAAVEYLKKQGVPEDLITYSIYNKNEQTKTVYLDDLGNKEEQFVGYSVSRSIHIKGFDNVDLIEELYSKIELDFEEMNLHILPRSPYYYYAQTITDIKANLMERAAENARSRATVIAENTGVKIGKLIYARQGAFNGFGDDGFGSGGFVGGESREHILNAQISAIFAIK